VFLCILNVKLTAVPSWKLVRRTVGRVWEKYWEVGPSYWPAYTGQPFNFWADYAFKYLHDVQ